MKMQKYLKWNQIFRKTDESWHCIIVGDFEDELIGAGTKLSSDYKMITLQQ